MENKDSWILEEIKIKFERGYDFKEEEHEKHDRYEGSIKFRNGHNESFNMNIPLDMTARYMDLMRNEIIQTADTLGKKIADSIKLVEIENDEETTRI